MNFPKPEILKPSNQAPPNYISVPGYKHSVEVQVKDAETVKFYIGLGYSLETATDMAKSQMRRRQMVQIINRINNVGLTDYQNQLMRDWILLHEIPSVLHLDYDGPKIDAKKGTITIPIKNRTFDPQPVMLFNSMSRLTVPLSKNVTTVFRFHAKPESKIKVFFKKLFRL